MSRRKSLGTVSRKFLDPELIERTIQELADLAREQKVVVVLAGGVAMQLYGSDRFTQDIDVVVDAPLEGLEEVGQLSFGGVSARTPSNAPVDVILRTDDYAPLYEAAMGDCRRMRGVPLPVVTREYLAAMKFGASRGKDLDDLAFLVLRTPLSVPRTRRLVMEHLGAYAGREFDNFVADVRALGGRR